MKKFITIVLFIVLATLAIYYSFYRKNSTLWFSDASFSINKANEVTRIVISNPGKSITLLKMKNGWKVDSIEAKQDLVESLLKISEELEIVSPIAISQRDSILNKIKQGTHITFYLGQRKSYTYSICKWNDRVYAQRNRSKALYCISVKGYPEIDLTKIYNPEKQFWITNRLFNFRPEEIRLVQIDYPDKPDRSFKIEKLAFNRYSLKDNKSIIPSETIDSAVLNEYLHFYPDIRYYRAKDSLHLIEKNISSANPFFHLIINSEGGELTEIRGYKKFDVKSDAEDPFEFYAIGIHTGLILLKYNDFDPILTGKDYFLKK